MQNEKAVNPAQPYVQKILCTRKFTYTKLPKKANPSNLSQYSLKIFAVRSAFLKTGRDLYFWVAA